MDAIRYFKDRAKAELRETRATGLAGLSLQQVQHQVAVTAGYRSWSDLIHASEPDVSLALTMDREPHLNLNGFGPGSYSGTLEERRARAAAWRLQLRARAEQVEEVRDWLQHNIAPRKTLNDDAHSYSLKHIAERAMGTYVSNGELIAAAIIAGYTYRRPRYGSPNTVFGMSSRSISAARGH